MTEQQTGIVVAAAILIAAAVGYYVFVDGEDSSTSCALTGAAVGVLATGLTKGHSPAQIASTAGAGVFASGVCNRALDTWSSDPSQTVAFTVNGEKFTVTGNDLSVNLTPTPTCDDWLFEFMRQRCYAGVTGPPSGG